ncbi:toll-like receptor 4 [Saccostrea echinata]|uniref:toll-like receptor 4 n=1 Tax=Saccostrea echinata TaxID=191078 RepID=UPI002A801084|nr:toll-like receptor 4 [Saccostrea echinata]
MYLLLLLSSILFADANTYGEEKRVSYCPTTKCFCRKRSTADCSERNLSTLPRGLPRSIKTLILNGNNFPDLEDNDFNPVAHLKLEILRMKNCSIERISKFAFQTLKSLVNLDLSYNKLSGDMLYLATRSLGKSRLKTLDVSGNYFNGSGDQFSGFRSDWFLRLREVSLINTNIEDFNFSSLSKLKKLKKLNLGGNRITKLHVSKKTVLPKLQYLRLANNRLRDTGFFQKGGHCLQKLTHLDLSRNPLHAILSRSFVKLTSLSTLIIEHLQGKPTVEKRALESQSLLKLSVDSFPGYIYRLFKYCPQLQELHMRRMTLFMTNLTEMLSPLKRLRSLLIRGCGIRYMPSLQELSELQSLDFTSNHIQSLQIRDIENLWNLEKIYLGWNSIFAVSQSSFPEFIWKKKKLRLDLSSNPFSCDCDLEWFSKWLRKNSHRVIAYPARYICKTPLKWQKQSLSNVDFHMCHQLNQNMILSFIFCGIISIISFSIVLVWKLRWDIKYYIHIWRRRNPKRYTRLPSVGYQYDGFVAYNTRDRKWIMSELVENLENRRKYKLCLHERDIIPGGIFVDEILDNIEVSRKFILILSPNFMSDQWCQYEATLANHALVDGRVGEILLIVLGKLISEHMTNSMKILLKSVTNIEWTENKNGQKLFWSRITQLMDR